MLHLRLESLTRGGALALLQVTLLDALRLRLMVTLSLIHFFLRLSLCVHTFDETMLHSASTGCRTLQREQHTSIGWHLLLQKCLLRHDFKYCIIMRLYPCYDDIGTLSSPLLSSPLLSSPFISFIMQWRTTDGQNQISFQLITTLWFWVCLTHTINQSTLNTLKTH